MRGLIIACVLAAALLVNGKHVEVNGKHEEVKTAHEKDDVSLSREKRDDHPEDAYDMYKNELGRPDPAGIIIQVKQEVGGGSSCCCGKSCSGGCCRRNGQNSSEATEEH
ncbi:uncharacterized protein LOC122245666 [Penaeus japonicus]|uniref:uncharacterized protein LOC122245666 n=1 Tax=Penaeus japonicus TaxID=27405 RepID=UPI001C710469|nr:uncharacterized protein LOC122245666 [Penaeus japonicus]